MSTTTPEPNLALDPTQVHIGTNNLAGIYVAPAGTAAPTLLDDFADPWMSLGYLSADGPTVSQSSSSTDITPWQSTTPIRTLITARGVTIHVVMWQINALTLSVYFDVDPTSWDNTTPTQDLQVRSDNPQHIFAVAIDTNDAGQRFRLSFTRATLSAVGDMAISRGATIPLDATLSALDDNGVLARLQIASSTGDATTRTFSGGKDGKQQLANTLAGRK